MIKPTDAGRMPILFYGLVVASVVLPLLVLGTGLALTWRSALSSAREDLRRGLALTVEQATRVLDSDLLVAGRVNDMLSGLDDEAIVAGEADLRDRILPIIRRLPHIRDLAVIGGNGRLLLATQRFPVDHRLEVTDRDYFQALRDRALPFSIGSFVVGRLSDHPSASIAIRRGPAQAPFHGVIVVILLPHYFEALDRALFQGRPAHTAGIYREDGSLLAWYPPTIPYTGLPPHSTLLSAIAKDPIQGLVRIRDTPDRVDRLIAYRRLETYPVYVAVGRNWDSIQTTWWSDVANYLAIGIPAVIGLIGLSLMAARRGRRESAALASLQAEVRRRETAESALRQAQKMEAIGRLTGGIAHDFNNHLTVISSNIELLKRRLSAGNENVLHLADAALQGVQRAATLTHRLLGFSRQQPPDPEPLDVGQLVAGMVDLLRRTLGEKIIIRSEAADGLWLTRVDANQLENALLNIAVNARDAMPEGGTLTIATANLQLGPDDGLTDMSPGQYVEVSVADTGIGMGADVIARAFEPFFSTKPISQGTGLSMVYDFVKQSGGDVQIVSEPGKGSSVKLLLPRYVREPEGATAGTRLDQSPRQGAGETILVVEDDAAVRRAAVEELQELGYSVLEAPDAMEAFRLLVDRGGVDLLFTDVGLPGGVNGRALADAARNLNGSLKVLFTTGYGRGAGETSLTDAMPVLPKPFDLRELGAKVREVLDAPARTDAVWVHAAQKA